MFAEMITGWQSQQRARFLRPETVKQRVAVVRRFVAFSGLYPWRWMLGRRPRRGFLR